MSQRHRKFVKTRTLTSNCEKTGRCMKNPRAKIVELYVKSYYDIQHGGSYKKCVSLVADILENGRLVKTVGLVS